MLLILPSILLQNLGTDHVPNGRHYGGGEETRDFAHVLFRVSGSSNISGEACLPSIIVQEFQHPLLVFQNM